MSRIAPYIISAWAGKLGTEITNKVISELSDMDADLSGDNSGLLNVWEEICAQVQREESYAWPAYVETIRTLLQVAIEELDRASQMALWAVTDEGWDYIYDYGDEPDSAVSAPLCTDDTVAHLMGQILSAAADYESPSLYQYIWGADDPSYDDYEDDYEDENEDEDTYDDLCPILVIHRKQIESLDLESTLEFLRTLIPAQDPAHVWSYKNSLELTIAGYEDDLRELYSIPEVCHYLRAIDQDWSFWFFFLTPSSIRLVGMCLAAAESVALGKAYIPPDNLAAFLNWGFRAVNLIFDHYGFPESENEKLTEITLQAFD